MRLCLLRRRSGGTVLKSGPASAHPSHPISSRVILIPVLHEIQDGEAAVVRIMRRPSNAVDRLSSSGSPSRRRASMPAPRSTPARLMMASPAAGTNPYQPGGAQKPVGWSVVTWICWRAAQNSRGCAISSAVMKISRRSRSIQSVLSRIPVSSFTNATHSPFPSVCLTDDQRFYCGQDFSSMQA